MGGGNRCEDVGGVRAVETVEHLGKRQAQRGIRDFSRRRQRRTQKDDAEVGVLTDRLEGRLDRCADAGSDTDARRCDKRSARLSASDKVLSLHAVAGRESMHIARLGRISSARHASI